VSASAAAVLNALSDEAARDALARCCAAHRWVDAMLATRPFASSEALHACADLVWATLERPDFLEAFAQHPAIGARAEALSAWSAEEQARAAASGNAEGATELQALNEAYAARFGYTFIVCATGKTADDILAALRARLHNDATTELAVAAAEQARITHLRLQKLAR
jgi:OHCU decarboxylase